MKLSGGQYIAYFNETINVIDKDLAELFNNILPSILGRYIPYLICIEPTTKEDNNFDISLHYKSEHKCYSSRELFDDIFFDRLVKEEDSSILEYKNETIQEINYLYSLLASSDRRNVIEKKISGLVIKLLLDEDTLNIVNQHTNPEIRIYRQRVPTPNHDNSPQLFLKTALAMAINDTVKNNFHYISEITIFGKYMIFLGIEIEEQFYKEHKYLFFQANPHVIQGYESFIIQTFDILFDKWREKLYYGLYYSTSDEIMTVDAIIQLAAMDITCGRGLPAYSFYNLISSFPYENAYCHGKIAFLKEINGEDRITNFIRFDLPKEIRKGNERLIRKLLEMSSNDYYLIVEDGFVVGIAKIADKSDIHILNFKGFMKWELLYGEFELISYNEGKFKYTESSWEQEISKIEKRFNNMNLSCIKKIVEELFHRKCGAMIIIFENAEDAILEVNRLAGLGRGIKLDAQYSYSLTDEPELMLCFSAIDGAVIIDSNGLCYGIGIIVDGKACANGLPERGARYNSANNYIKISSSHYSCVACVVSEDRMVNAIVH